MDNEKKLKPCPFCGEKRLLEVRTIERRDRPKCKFVGMVSCLNCFSQAGNHGFDWTAEEAEENAIKSWNRRAKTD